jgi:hypothetical protein
VERGNQHVAAQAELSSEQQAVAQVKPSVMHGCPEGQKKNRAALHPSLSGVTFHMCSINVFTYHSIMSNQLWVYRGGTTSSA